MVAATSDQLAAARQDLITARSNAAAYRASNSNYATDPNYQSNYVGNINQAQVYLDYLESTLPPPVPTPTTIEKAIAPEPKIEPVKKATESEKSIPIVEPTTELNKIECIPNPLHKFSSYTYALQLCLLLPEESKIILDKTKSKTTFTPKNVLVATGGRREAIGSLASNRNKYFDRDFFFDKLEFETIIGMGANSGSSNVTTINFTLTEPYGITFLDSLAKACNDPEINIPDFKKAAYLLIIDFYGYDEHGLPKKINGMAKFIPIQLLEVKMKLTAKGAEYTISAVPYHQQAFSSVSTSSPARFEIIASDLKSFFTTGTESVRTEEGKLQDEKIRKEIAVKSKTYDAIVDRVPKTEEDKKLTNVRVDILSQELNALDQKLKNNIENSNGVTSLPSAMNKWFKEAYKQTADKFIDVIEFDLKKAPNLINGKFPDRTQQSKDNVAPPEKNPPTVAEKTISEDQAAKIKKAQDELDVANKNLTDVEKTLKDLPDGSSVDQLTQANIAVEDAKIEVARKEEAFKTAQIEPKPTTPTTEDKANSSNRLSLTVGQGDTIMQIITNAITSSSYITDQLKIFDLERITGAKLTEFLSTPLNWFKVTSQVMPGEYDKKHGKPQLTTTYIITEYKVPNWKNPNAPKGPIQPSFVVKEYNYIFTGKNTEVLDLDLTFDTQYYVMQQVVQPGASTTQENPNENVILLSDIKDTDTISQEQLQNYSSESLFAATGLRPKVVKVSGTPQKQIVDTISTTAAKHVTKSVNAQGGDMIDINMKIIGDPDFIKQDDIFANHMLNTDTKDPRKLNNTEYGSLVTDANQIFIRVKFNSPADYNRQGLAKPNSDGGAGISNLFSGYYQILTVNNTFQGGKFEQQVHAVRNPNVGTTKAKNVADRATDTTKAASGNNRKAKEELGNNVGRSSAFPTPVSIGTPVKTSDSLMLTPGLSTPTNAPFGSLSGSTITQGVAAAPSNIRASIVDKGTLSVLPTPVIPQPNNGAGFIPTGGTTMIDGQKVALTQRGGTLADRAHNS